MLLLISSLFISISFADEFVEDGTTTIGGYGEMHYDMEGNDGDGKLDFHRFIFYIKHQFNSQWSMMSEVEIEHNMVYSCFEGEDADGNAICVDEGGYLAMEQAHLNYWNGTWGWKGGVLLQPVGIINEYHEPPTFMSVERPEYNKRIIPTTWFGNGFAFYGAMGDFNWNVTMTGDLDGDMIGEGLRDARLKGVGETTEGGWLTTLQGSWTGMDGLKVGGSYTMNSPMRSATAENTGCGLAVGETISDLETEDVDGVNTLVTGACGDGIAEQALDVTLTEFNATWSKNNLYARMEYGMIDYTNNFHQNAVTVNATPEYVWTVSEDEDGNDTSTCNVADVLEADCVGYQINTNGDDAINGADATWTSGTAVREIKSSSGYYLDLGYNVGSLLGWDNELYLWTRTSSYNKDDDGDAHDISLFGVTYKPANNISFKVEMGESGGDDVMRMGLGYMF